MQKEAQDNWVLFVEVATFTAMGKKGQSVNPKAGKRSQPSQGPVKAKEEEEYKEENKATVTRGQLSALSSAMKQQNKKGREEPHTHLRGPGDEGG